MTWQRHAGRAAEISHALGGQPLHVHFAALTRRPLVPLRYALSVVSTAARLARTRPRAVIVTNPPVFPGLVVAAYSALTGAPFLLDNHTSGFGVKGNVVSRRLLGVTRWLARRSAGVMVTVADYVHLVESWGARGLIVHEAPPRRQTRARAHDAGPHAGPHAGSHAGSHAGHHPTRPRVLFVCVFADDEPVAEVLDAARLLPEADVVVTGDVSRCPPETLTDLPENVVLTGFLDLDAYAAELARADVVLALTTEPTSIMRAAYEAVYAHRPLVVSDWPSLREVFPFAHTAANEPAALATAVRAALADPDPAARDAAALAQRERWDGQLAALRQALERG